MVKTPEEIARDVAFLGPIYRERYRRLNGPICALCVYSKLTAVDLEREFPMDPTAPMPESMSIDRCQVLPINTTADGGRRCHKYSRSKDQC